MKFKVTSVILSVLVLSVWLISCADVPTNGPTPPDFRSEFRFVSAAADLGDVGVSVDGQSVGNVSFMGEIAHADYPAGSRVVTLSNGDELRVPMTFDERATVLILPLTAATREFIKLVERRTYQTAATSTARYRAVHASPDAGFSTITVVGADTTISGSGIYRDFTEYASIPAGDYAYTIIAAAGDTVTGNVTLANTRQTIVLVGSTGSLSILSLVDN